MNGIVDHGDQPRSPKAYLGKRKRTSSPDAVVEPVTDSSSESFKRNLEKTLESMRLHDPTGYIIRHGLPPRSDEPLSKRSRTNSSNTPAETIEGRVQNGAYSSAKDLLSDLAYLQGELDRDTHANGHMRGLDAIRGLLSNLDDSESKESTTEMQNGKHDTSDEVRPAAAQVLSLRSQMEGGVKQLFSGLPRITNGSVQEISGRKLPNGFEVTAVTMMDRSTKTGKDSRTFGEVFAPHRNTQPLDMPRDRKRRDVWSLDFVSPHTVLPPTAKNDFRFEKLALGESIQYSTNEVDATSFATKKKAKVQSTPLTLFKTAFSSFAPSTDHSMSVLAETDRSRRWWRTYTTKETTLDLPETNQENGLRDQVQEFHPDGFEDVINNFVSESDLDDRDESEKLLSEVSDLLEALSSYQNIRDSEPARGPSSASKPTKPEFDIHQMLKSQLQILVSSLPPYAVAKLNGDQLDALNISTNLLVTPPEFAGTSHADEYTHRRPKAALVASTSVPRPNAVGPTRNNYGTPASAYNAQAYNRNAPATAYATKQAPAYNTPRVGTTAQTAPYTTQPNYRAASAVYPNSTIQQFQRAVANGLAQPGTPTAQAYAQRPTQPGAQRSHDGTTPYAGGLPTQGSLTNGQVTQNHQSSLGATSQAELNHRMTESMKLLQQQSAQTRQASGTPQPANGTNHPQQQTTAGSAV